MGEDKKCASDPLNSAKFSDRRLIPTVEDAKHTRKSFIVSFRTPRFSLLFSFLLVVQGSYVSSLSLLNSQWRTKWENRMAFT